MPIVDSQVHIGNAETPERPWLQDEDLEWVMGRSVCEWLGWSL